MSVSGETESEILKYAEMAVHCRQLAAATTLESAYRTLIGMAVEFEEAVERLPLTLGGPR